MSLSLSLSSFVAVRRNSLGCLLIFDLLYCYSILLRTCVLLSKCQLFKLKFVENTGSPIYASLPTCGRKLVGDPTIPLLPTWSINNYYNLFIFLRVRLFSTLTDNS